jgi:hypothetical protein
VFNTHTHTHFLFIKKIAVAVRGPPID